MLDEKEEGLNCLHCSNNSIFILCFRDWSVSLGEEEEEEEKDGG